MAKLQVDFTDVEGGLEAVPEGAYIGVVESAERKTSQSSGEPMLEVHFKITEGKYRGSVLYEFWSLQKQALFRMKQRLTALGFDVPAGPIVFDTDDLVGIAVRIQTGAPRKLPNSELIVSNIIAVVAAEGEGGEVIEEAEIEQPVVTTRKKLVPTAEQAAPTKPQLKRLQIGRPL